MLISVETFAKPKIRTILDKDDNDVEIVVEVPHVRFVVERELEESDPALGLAGTFQAQVGAAMDVLQAGLDHESRRVARAYMAGLLLMGEPGPIGAAGMPGPMGPQGMRGPKGDPGSPTT